MRPTVDEQLAGVQRLLGLAEADPALSSETLELLGNAQRLVTRVAGSWATTLPFLVEDNARLAELLGHDVATPDRTVDPTGGGATTDVTAATARNEALRGSLAQLIQDLPGDPAGRERRAEIRRYLLRRVAADPT